MRFTLAVLVGCGDLQGVVRIDEPPPQRPDGGAGTEPGTGPGPGPGTEPTPGTGPEADPWAGVDVRVCADGSGDHVDLQAAIDAAAAGVTIGACAGTYGPIRVGDDVDVRIVGVAGAAATRIEGGDEPALDVDRGALELSGFTLTGTGRDDPLRPKGAITVFEGTLLLADSVVEQTSGPFTLFFDEDFLVLEDVIWRDNRTDWLWYLWQGDDDGPAPGTATLSGNVVHGGTHVTVLEAQKVKTLLVRNNVFADVTIDTARSAFVLRRFDAATPTVANNVFWNVDDLDPFGGRLLDIEADFLNNVVAGCDAWNLYPLEASWSLFWDNGVDYERVIEGSGNAFTDPRFANPEALDFTLLPGSPAIDAGHPDPAWNDPDGSRNDMGVHGGPGAR